MSYRVIKTIRGRRYLYEQRSWREGKRVRSQSRCLGPLDPPVHRRRKGVLGKIRDLVNANRATPEARGMRAAERFAAQVEREQRESMRAAEKERAARGRLESLEELDALNGLGRHQRDEAAQLGGRDVVGQDRDDVGDAVLRGTEDGQRIPGEEQGRSLDPMGVEENAAGVEAGVESQKG